MRVPSLVPLVSLLSLILPAGTTTDYAHPELLVDTAFVAAHAADPNVRVVDMRTAGYAQGHILGAVHLDNAPIRSTRPPTFLPTEDEFSKLMSGLGISDNTKVIAYDDRGGIYAARLWFVLTAFGHPNVALLNGGWTKWTSDSRASTTIVPNLAPGNFHAHLDPAWVATADDVLKAMNAKGTRIVDARTAGEITGADTRGIKHGGAIPTSVPVYWEDTLDPATKTFKSADDIATLYRHKGITADDAVITYCQIGMRASHDLFTLMLIGQTKLSVYYGSWEEWGNRDDLPINKGRGGQW